MRKIVFCFLAAIIIGIIGVGGAFATETPELKITLLNQDPSPARAGDVVDVRFRVENTGTGNAQDVEVEFLQSYPFTVIDSDPVHNLGLLYAYQTGKNYITTNYRLKINKDAVKGTHELKLRYRENKGNWVMVSFNIDITSKEFAQIIYVDKAKLDPGKETEMKFTVTNIGNAPLQNLVFSWSEPNGVILPVFSDDTKYIKYLDVGDSIELKYTVIADVNAKPGLYQLDLSLEYESTGATATAIKTKAGIFVGGETDFDVAFSESSQGTTSLSVANTGNNPALSVSVRIPPQQGFRVSGSTSAIIGNLDKGDYTIVSFQIVQVSMGNFSGTERQRQQQQAGQQRQITQNSNSNQRAGFTALGGASGGNNNLRVIIDYTDTTGSRRSVEKNVPIQFRSLDGDATPGAGQVGQFQRRAQNSFWSSSTFYIIGLLIIIGIGVWIYQKKRSAKK